MDGSGNVLARHDYLPFGEELWAGVGMRTTGQKFGVMDQTRMRYGLTEKDEATGLDRTWFRKYENTAGRWTSPDSLGGNIGNPQSFNRYSYVGNNPTNLIDPTGLEDSVPCDYIDGEPVYCEGDVVVTNTNSRLSEYLWVLNSRFSAFLGGVRAGMIGGLVNLNSGNQIDPCAHLLPANVPPGVNVDQNIALAEKLVQEWLHTNPPEPGAAAANFSTLEVSRVNWFTEQTGDHGPMDYKYLTTDMRYDDFGNFNYGAVGAALQFTPGTLLRVAGWAQQTGKYAYLGRGKASSNRVTAFLGVGGEPPFGDKPGDQIQIQNGIDYFNCRKAHPL